MAQPGKQVPIDAAIADSSKSARIQLAQATTQPRQARPLPGGASSLRESYQDWQVACAQQAAGKRCALSQQQTDQQTRQRVLAIDLSPSGDKVEGVLVVPFGLALDMGVTLQIDDGAAATSLRFRTCLPAGCIVPVSFDARMLAELRNGTTGKLKATADSGQEIPFTISLKGFAAALDRTVALAR